MRFAMIRHQGRQGIALEAAGKFRCLFEDEAAFPGSITDLVARGAGFGPAAAALREGPALDPDDVEFLPPIPAPSKVLCAGLNYVDHAKEVKLPVPEFPTMFGRFPSSLIGHGAPLVRPHVSEQFDYESELAVVIGKGGRYITKETALDHVAGYSVFNDATLRDYQFQTSQWMLGKNFDGTGAFGPFFVPADDLPPGCRGLRIVGRLNGHTVQDSNIDQLIFDVATLIERISVGMTLHPGDVILTGTPAGVGVSRTPALFMKPGDVIEVEIEQLGILRNAIVAEPAVAGTN